MNERFSHIFPKMAIIYKFHTAAKPGVLRKSDIDAHKKNNEKYKSNRKQLFLTVFSFQAGNRCISPAIAMNFPSMGFNVVEEWFISKKYFFIVVNC